MSRRQSNLLSHLPPPRINIPPHTPWEITTRLTLPHFLIDTCQPERAASTVQIPGVQSVTETGGRSSHGDENFTLSSVQRYGDQREVEGVPRAEEFPGKRMDIDVGERRRDYMVQKGYPGVPVPMHDVAQHHLLQRNQQPPQQRTHQERHHQRYQSHQSHHQQRPPPISYHQTHSRQPSYPQNYSQPQHRPQQVYQHDPIHTPSRSGSSQTPPIEHPGSPLIRYSSAMYTSTNGVPPVRGVQTGYRGYSVGGPTAPPTPLGEREMKTGFGGRGYR